MTGLFFAFSLTEKEREHIQTYSLRVNTSEQVRNGDDDSVNQDVVIWTQRSIRFAMCLLPVTLLL